MTDLFATMKQQKEEVKENIEKKLSEVKRAETQQQVKDYSKGVYSTQENKYSTQETSYTLSTKAQETFKSKILDLDQTSQKASKLFTGTEKDTLLQQISEEQNWIKIVYEDNNTSKIKELEASVKKRESYFEELSKSKDLTNEQKTFINDELKKMDDFLMFLTKFSLSNRDTLKQRQNDEIFERTLLKNIQNKKNIDQFTEETIMNGVSNYYFAVREMAKEIENVNSEKVSKKEKEIKVEEIFEKHYENLKIGNEDHDKTLNSFLMYNITMEFGSKEQKENVSKEIKVKTEDGEETTLKDRCNKEILELVPKKVF